MNGCRPRFLSLRWLALVCVAALLASCVPAPAPVPTPAPVLTAVPSVRISFAAAETRRAAFEPLIAAFNAENPDIAVRFVPLAFDTPLADAVRQADSVFGYLASAAEGTELVRDLAPFVDADASFQPNDFYPAAWPVGEQSQRLVLPLALSVPLLDYNAELWARQSLQPPDVTWIWGDLLAAAEQLARAGDGTAGLYDEGGRLTLQAELANAGVSLGLGTRLDQPTIVAAVGRVQALAARGAILTALSSTEQTLAERIRTGQLGLWPSELSAEATRDGPLPFTTARMPFPLLRDQLLARPLGAMISVGTQHPDAAWRWLSFLSRRQVQPAGDGSAGAVVVPARRSVAVSSWADLEPTTSGAIQLLLERQASTSGLLDGSSASEIALYEALGRVLAEGQSPEDALAEAQAALPAAASAPTAAATAFAVATPVPAQAEGELTIIRFALNNAFGDALIPILDAFQEQNPTIAIDFVAPPELGRFSVPYASVADNAANADCFAWLGPPEPSEVAKVVDLNTLIDADPTFPRDDYWPLALQTFEREGRLTGLPYSLGVPVLWYNMDRFDAAGLPYPTSDWTIEEVLASAEQLTGDGAYGLFSGGWPSLALYLDQVGVALTSGSGNLVQPRFTEPEVVEALGRYVELVQRITPFDGRFTYSEPSTMAEMVELDAAAMAFMGNLMQWGLEYDLGARFGVVMLRDTRPVSYWRDMALYISASSPHIDTCWSWIRHLSESDLSGAFSARRSLGQEALASPQALPGADEAYAIYAQLMEQPRDTESMANFLSEPITQYWLLRALDRVFRHNGSLAAELTEAQFVTEQYLACVQGGEAAATCARQVDPTFAPWVFNL